MEGFAGRREASAWCQLVRGAGGQEGRGARAPAGRARRAGRPTGASLGEGSPGRRCGAQTALTCAVGAGSVAKARGAAWAGKGGAAEGERREVEGGRQRAGGGSVSRMPTRCERGAPQSLWGPGLAPAHAGAPRLERWLLAAHCGGEVCPLPKRRHLLRGSERVLELHHFFLNKLTWSPAYLIIRRARPERSVRTRFQHRCVVGRESPAQLCFRGSLPSHRRTGRLGTSRPLTPPEMPCASVPSPHHASTLQSSALLTLSGRERKAPSQALPGEEC